MCESRCILVKPVYPGKWFIKPDYIDALLADDSACLVQPLQSPSGSSIREVACPLHSPGQGNRDEEASEPSETFRKILILKQIMVLDEAMNSYRF